MNWYYAENGQQKGPISDMEFTTLARDGIIKPDTLVWREGLASWMSMDKARPDLAVQAGAPVIGGVAVAEQNKDILVQQLREGAVIPGVNALNVTGMRYGGFWIRVAAKLIDSILIYAIVFAITFVIIMAMTAGNVDSSSPMGGTELLIQFVPTLLFYAFNTTYGALMTWKFGGTLGKLAVGVRVVQADGAPLTLGLAVGRAFADILSSFCGLIYLMVAFDEPEKRALHDHICSTRVIYK